MIFLKKFDIQSSDFKACAEDVNRRMNSPINSQVHKIPDRTKQTRKSGRPPKEKTDEASAAEQKTTKKRGRPPGRKSGKAQEKEPQTAMNTKSESSVLKKSDSVLEKIALAAAQAAMSAMKEPSAPRKRGRPRKIAEQS
jgi:hypothetical protein